MRCVKILGAGNRKIQKGILDDAVDLVLFASSNGILGDIFLQKYPVATVTNGEKTFSLGKGESTYIPLGV